MSNLAPIALFVFNRPEHTREVLLHLLANEEAAASDLIVFSDGIRSEADAENVSRVRDVIRDIRGFRSLTIVEREKNFGLAKSVVEGLNLVLSEHRKVVVMEDDILTSRNFLSFMNTALDFYEDESRIFCVSGYSFPITVPQGYTQQVYGYYRACSWGWGTWANRWRTVDWNLEAYSEYRNSVELRKRLRRGGSDLGRQLKLTMTGKRDSWFMPFQFSCSMQQRLCVYPVCSKAKNIGTDGTGRHFKHHTRRFDVDLDNRNGPTRFVKILDVDPSIAKRLTQFFSLKDRFLIRLQDVIRDLKV